MEANYFPSIMNNRLEDRIYTYSEFMKQKFGRKVFRVGLSTGIPCPHRVTTGGCIFCNSSTFTGEYQSSGLSVDEQLVEAIPRIKQTCGDVGLLAYFQDETSTAGDLELLSNIYKKVIKHPEILGLVVSTRPEYVTEEILKLLTSLNVPVWIEIGLQSVHEASLRFLNRGHGLHEVEKAIELCEIYEIDLGVHLITGIPGETILDMQDTIKYISSKTIIKEVKFHNLVVYKGTELERLYREKKFEIVTVDDQINILSQLIPYLRGDIVVSRLFTSNIRRTQIALGNYPGSKPEWLNRLRLALVEQDIFQGSKTGLPFVSN